MKKFVALLVMVAVVGAVAGLAFCEEEKPKDMTLKGTIVKVEKNDAGKEIVVLKVKHEEKEREMKIATDDKTVVTIDGKDGKVADLKADMKAEVTKPRGRETVASKIVATTAVATAPAKG